MRTPRTLVNGLPFSSLARQYSPRVNNPVNEMAVNTVILTGANADTATRATRRTSESRRPPQFCFVANATTIAIWT
jgi:hypothetical protein